MQRISRATITILSALSSLALASGCGSSSGTSSGNDGGSSSDDGGNNLECQPLAQPPMVGVFVATDGRADAAGTKNDPLDLVSAFSGDGQVKAGDTVWLADGTYDGSLISQLQGTPAAPIVVRPEYGARAIIDTLIGDGFRIDGEWTEYHDLEVMSSAGDRESVEDSSNPSDIALGGGINIFGPNVKFINGNVHDTSGGFGFWTPSIDSEIYGTTIYNNGWTAPGRGHGHAIYTQNNKGTKRLAGNIIFFGFGTGIHAYTEGGSIQGFNVEDNVWFHTGASDPRSSQRKDNCLIGGFQPVARTTLRANLGWSLNRGTRLGYGGDVNNLDLNFTDNFLVEDLWLQGNWEQVAMTGNTFIGGLLNVDPADYPGNEFTETPPEGGNKIFVYENEYDDTRARVTIYNWDSSPSVNVDLSTVLKQGEEFQIYSVYDLHGMPVLAGQFDGEAIAIPMGSVEPPQPLGLADGISGDDDPGSVFGTFIVRHQGCQ